MGRNWLDILYRDWRQSFNINKLNGVSTFVDKLKTKYDIVFDQDFSNPIKGFVADIVMKPDIQLKFFKGYTVPYSLRDQVELELARLTDTPILYPAKFSRCASPMVAVKKKGSLRLCMDAKVWINKNLEIEHYPLPRIDDLLTGLCDSSIYCVLDLTGAYEQVAVSEESQKYLTINTHKGLFRFRRLCFGVASAPSIFQSIMDRILLLWLPKVKCYMDDILVGGSDYDECKRNLVEVLERLKEYNVKVNLQKCVFLKRALNMLVILFLRKVKDQIKKNWMQW